MNQSTINIELFWSRFAGLEDVALNMIENFKRLAPEMVNAVEKSAKENDFHSLEIAAHTLKGAISNFHCENAIIVAEKLEKACKLQSLTEIPDLIKQLKLEVDSVLCALPALINQKKAS